MSSRFIKQGLLAAVLAAGLTAAHAQAAPTAPLDLSLHLPQQAWLAAPGAVADLDTHVDLRGMASAPGAGGGEYRVAPRVEVLAGYDPYTVYQALDFEPRAGDYAVGLKLLF